MNVSGKKTPLIKSSIIKKSGRILVMCLAAGMFFCGCSTKAQKEKLADAEEMVEAGNYAEALESFSQLEKTETDKRRVYRGMGIAYMGMEQYEDAVSAFEKSLKEAGGRVSDWEYDTNYYIAAALEKSGKRKEAIETWSNLLAVRKDSESYFQRGMLYLKDKKEEKAKEDFDRAVEADSSDAALPIRIYKALEADYPELGSGYLQQLVAKEAKGGEELYYKGLAYQNLKEITAAEDTLKQAVKKGCSKANLALGAMFCIEENYDYAMEFYQAYLKESPEDAEAYEQLMAAQIARQDYAGALATLDTAGEKDVNSETLAWYEIICYEYSGEFETAREKAAACVDTWPENEKVQKEYEFLKTR